MKDVQIVGFLLWSSYTVSVQEHQPRLQSKGRRFLLLSSCTQWGPSYHIHIYRFKEVLTPEELKIKVSSVRLPCELTVWRKKNKPTTNNRKPNCLSTVGSWYNISLNWVQLLWPLEGQHWKQFPKPSSGTWAFCHLHTNEENTLKTQQIQTPGWLPIFCLSQPLKAAKTHFNLRSTKPRKQHMLQQFVHTERCQAHQ